MTEASQRALTRLRDLSTLQWYVIPLLAVVFYVYATEVKKARASGNWDAVLAGLTLFGMDFVNETWNGWVLVLTGRSAFWTAPGPTALRTMVGWNIEIMFMFALLGIIYQRTIDEDPAARLLGLPDRWFWALGYAAVCVAVEVFLNRGGLLVWDYRWWNRGPLAILPIFVCGYLWFFLAAKYAVERPTLRAKVAVPAVLSGVAIALNVVGLGLLGLTY
jgi:hypothetical protein